MSKQIFNKIVLFAVVIFLLILAPSQINLPNQSIVRAICTGLAIDTGEKLPDGIMLTAQIVIPQAGGQYAPNLSLVTSEGSNLLDAFTQMDYQIGKKVRLAHCCFVLIGYEASQQNLAETLDYLVRGNNAGNNTLLVHTKGKAKDLIKLSSDINSNEIDNIQTIVRYNDQYLATDEANLRSFYHNYLSPHGTSIMSCLNIREENAESGGGGSSSGGSSSGGSGESSAEPSAGGSTEEQTASPDQIENKGEISIFKRGKLAVVLTNEERVKFSWLDEGLNDHPVPLTHITDQNFDDATIGFTVTDKSIHGEYKFVNNTPCIYFDIELKLRTEMIEEASGKLPHAGNYNNAAIADAIQLRIASDVDDAMQIAKRYGFDAYDFYRSFKIANSAEWEKYLETLPDPDDYIQKIEVFVKTKINTYGIGSLTSATK